MTQNLIQEAISQHSLVEFRYGGLLRVVEPHTLGISRDDLRLLGYQIRGQSRSGVLPEWRIFSFAKVLGARILPEKFAGPRQVSGRDSQFERVLVQVTALAERPDAYFSSQSAAAVEPYVPLLLPAVMPDADIVSVAHRSGGRFAMLTSQLTQVIRSSIEPRLPQLQREFQEALRRDNQQNAKMGRHGGIAMYFPVQTALREIDRRADFVWEHIKAILAAGALRAYPNLVPDVQTEMQSYRELMLSGLKEELARIATQNGAHNYADLHARWQEGVERAVASARLYALALESEKAGLTQGPPAVTLSGTIHNPVFQYGPGASATVNQHFHGSDLEEIRRLISSLGAEIGQLNDEEGHKAVVVPALQQLASEAESGKLTLDRVMAVTNFLLGTWEKLVDLGAMTQIKAWLALKGTTG